MKLIDKILVNGKFGNRSREDYIKKNYFDDWKDVYKYSSTYGFDDFTWTRKLYHYMFDIQDRPKCYCGNYTKFRGRIDCVYQTFCSEKCCAISVNDKRQKTLEENNLKRLGVKNVFQLEYVKDKSKKTLKERYGVEHQMHLEETKEKIKNTNMERYGVEHTLQLPHIRERMLEKCVENWSNPEWVSWYHSIIVDKYGGVGLASDIIRNKYISFCRDKWGVDNSFQSEEIKEKIKNYYQSNYGVSNPQQVDEIHLKTIKSSYVSKGFRDTELYYQGTYELDFLEKYYDIMKIERSKSYKYNDNKIYYPDFFLPSISLTVEIKSSYTWNLHLEKNLLKQKFMIENEIPYIVIIDKNYDIFNEMVKTLT